MTGAEIGYQLGKKCENIIFIVEKTFKIAKVPSSGTYIIFDRIIRGELLRWRLAVDALSGLFLIYRAGHFRYFLLFSLLKMNLFIF